MQGTCNAIAETAPVLTPGRIVPIGERSGRRTDRRLRMAASDEVVEPETDGNEILLRHAGPLTHGWVPQTWVSSANPFDVA